MRARDPDTRPDIAWPAGLDGVEMGRLTWIGLSVAGLGWALLIGGAATTDALSSHARASFHSDLLVIAQSMIVSGFGLAIVGALQSGFGALNRFFAAVLVRSGQRAASAGPPPAANVSPVPVPRERRPYRTLADGTVEVETILGTRRFATMREASEFI